MTIFDTLRQWWGAPPQRERLAARETFTLAPDPLGTPRPQCGTPDPSYAEGIRKLADELPTEPKLPSGEEVAQAFPETERRVRSWLMREGYGRPIGTAYEDPKTFVITVSWSSWLPDSARKRTSWVDIKALRDDLDPHRPTSWTGLHGLQPPVRFRGQFDDDYNTRMDFDG